MDETTNLKLPYIAPSQAQKHVTHNEAIRALDALVQLSVTSRKLANAPRSRWKETGYVVPSKAVHAVGGQDGPNRRMAR